MAGVVNLKGEEEVEQFVDQGVKGVDYVHCAERQRNCLVATVAILTPYCQITFEVQEEK